MSGTLIGVAGQFQYASTSHIGAASIPVTRDIPAGHTLVVVGVWEGAGGSQPNMTIADDSGNTGTAAVGAIVSTTRQVVAGYLPISTLLPSGSHVNLDLDINRGEWAFYLLEWSGMAASPGDKTASNAATANGLINGGTTTATAQAAEVVVGAFAVGPGETVTAPSGWTLAGTLVTGTGGTTTHHQLAVVYQNVSTVGTQQAQANQNSSGAYAGVTMTLLVAAVQSLLPASDDTTASWTKVPSGAASFAVNNNDADDTTYNRCATPDGAHPLIEVLSNPGTTPPAGAAVAVRVRARANGASSATGVLSIVQGSTTRASATVTLTSSFAWYELDLTPTQVAAIVGGAGGWNGLKASFNPTAS